MNKATTASRDRLILADVYYPERLAEKIRAGADINVMPNDRTIMGLAVMEGMVESCRLLLEAGADPHRAREIGKNESLLMELFGSRFALPSGSGGPRKKVISDEDLEAIATLLVAHGADPNGIFNEGDTPTTAQCPLFIAATYGDMEGVRIMAKLGANVDQPCVNASTGEVKTAMSYAINAKAQELIITLLRLGAYHGGVSEGGGTLNGFQRCVKLGLDEVVEYYVRERGEDLDQRVMGRTLLDIAGNPSTRALLHALKTEASVQKAFDGESSHPVPGLSTKKNALAL